MLIAIVVVVILAALVVAVTQRTRSSANMAKDAANLRSIGAGLMAYVVDHEGALPVSAQLPSNIYGSSTYWFDLLNPYMGYEEYTPRPNFKFPLPTDTGTVFPLPWQLSPGKQVEPLQRQSVGYGWNLSNFGHDLTRAGDSGKGSGYGMLIAEVVNPSNTIIIGNSKDDDFEPENQFQNRYIYDYDKEKRYKYPSRYNGGANYLFVDGHVEWIAAERMNSPEVRRMFKTDR